MCEVFGHCVLGSSLAENLNRKLPYTAMSRRLRGVAAWAILCLCVWSLPCFVGGTAAIENFVFRRFCFIRLGS